MEGGEPSKRSVFLIVIRIAVGFLACSNSQYMSSGHLETLLTTAKSLHDLLHD